MSTPWEKLQVRVWDRIARSRARPLLYGLFGLLFVLTVAAGVIEKWETIRGVLPRRKPPVEVGKGDRDVMQEWVLRIAATDSLGAVAAAAEFRQALEASPDAMAALPKEAELEDVFAARDPLRKGQWLVVFDMIRADGTREAIEAAYTRFLAGAAGSPVSPWVKNSRVFYYSRAEYERTYGRIPPEPQP